MIKIFFYKPSQLRNSKTIKTDNMLIRSGDFSPRIDDFSGQGQMLNKISLHRKYKIFYRGIKNGFLAIDQTRTNHRGALFFKKITYSLFIFTA